MPGAVSGLAVHGSHLPRLLPVALRLWLAGARLCCSQLHRPNRQKNAFLTHSQEPHASKQELKLSIHGPHFWPIFLVQSGLGTHSSADPSVCFWEQLKEGWPRSLQHKMAQSHGERKPCFLSKPASPTVSFCSSWTTSHGHCP